MKYVAAVVVVAGLVWAFWRMTTRPVEEALAAAGPTPPEAGAPVVRAVASEGAPRSGMTADDGQAVRPVAPPDMGVRPHGDPAVDGWNMGQGQEEGPAVPGGASPDVLEDVDCGPSSHASLEDEGFPVPADQPLMSTIEEVRDGGYGVGSAAPLPDGRTPFGHPVKAWNDTKTYRDEHSPNYAASTPEVWFTDARAAERAGFRRVEE